MADDDVKIRLVSPTCRIVAIRFQPVRSAHVATPPSPQDFIEDEQMVDDEEISVHR